MNDSEAVRRRGSGRWKGGLASFLLPGAGQYLQARKGFAAVILFCYLASAPLICALFAASFIPVWLPLGLVPISWGAFIWCVYDASRPTAPVGWKRWLLIVIVGQVLIPTLEIGGLLTLCRVYRVPSASMSPTIPKGTVVYCLRAAYWHAVPQRGDIIAFSTENIPKLAVNGEVATFVKRVVGLPGDVLRIKSNSLLVNGFPYRYSGQQENYCSISGSSYLRSNEDEFTVPKGTCFVMGDHPSGSVDSRFFGPVPFASLRGKMEVIILPLGRSSRLE